MGQQAESERVLDPSFCSMSLVPASCRTQDGFVAVPIMAVTIVMAAAVITMRTVP